MSNNMDMLKNRLGKKAKTVKKVQHKEVENKDLILQHYTFDFEADTEILNYLKTQTHRIHLVASKAYTELGRVFSETQEELSGNNQHDGLFYKWFKSMGYTNDFVYKLINRNNLLVRFSDKQNLIESLPITLSYEISKPSCNEELREKVLNEEIRTLKEFKEAKLKLIEAPVEELKEANMDITEIIKTDYSQFKSQIKSFDKFIKEGLDKVEESKQKKIAKEIEQINKRIEKLLKGLN